MRSLRSRCGLVLLLEIAIIRGVSAAGKKPPLHGSVQGWCAFTRKKLGTGEGAIGLDGVAGCIRVDIGDLTESINRLIRYDSERPAPPVRQEPVGQAMVMNEVTVGRDGIGYRHITGTST